jgi:hypothetical protein
LSLPGVELRPGQGLEKRLGNLHQSAQRARLPLGRLADDRHEPRHRHVAACNDDFLSGVRSLDQLRERGLGGVNRDLHQSILARYLS